MTGFSAGEQFRSKLPAPVCLFLCRKALRAIVTHAQLDHKWKWLWEQTNKQSLSESVRQKEACGRQAGDGWWRLGAVTFG